MAYAFVQAPATAGTGTGLSVAKAFVSNVTAGSTLVAFATTDAGVSTGFTFSDNNGGSWQGTVGTMFSDSSTGQRIVVGYSENHPAGATTVTVTYNVSGSFLGIHIIEFSGGTTSSKDQTSPGADVAASGGVVTDTTTLVPTVDGELVVSMIVQTGAGAAAGSGFTAIVLDDANLMSSEYKIQGVKANIAPTFNVTGSVGIMSASFKPAAAAGGAQPFIPPRGFTSPQTLASNVRWDWNPAAAVTVAAAFPPQSSRPRTPHPPVRRGQSAAPPRVTVTVSPPTPTRARRWPFRRRGFASIPPPITVVVQAPAFPPQSSTTRRRPPFPRRGATSSTPPLIVVQPFPPQTTTPRRRPPFRRKGVSSGAALIIGQSFPPQSPRRVRGLPFWRRGFNSAPTPPTVAVTVYPFQQPSPRRKPWLPPVRRGKSVPPTPPQVIITAAPYPPQAGARRARPPFPRRGTSTPPPVLITVQPPPQPATRRSRFPFRRRPTSTPPPTVVTVTFPPQTPTRRRVPPFRRRTTSTPVTPPQVVFTVYPYPLATPRRRWWLPFRRRGRWFVPPIPPPSGREITIIPDLTTTRYSSDVTSISYSADVTGTRYGGGDMTGTRYSSDQTSTRYGADLNEQ